MLSKLLKANRPIELKISSVSAELEGIYKSRIEEVTQDYLVVGSPLKDGNVVPLGRGSVVEVFLWGETAIYTFPAVVHFSSYVPIPLLFLTLPKPDIIRKIQRRNFVRLTSFHRVKFKVVDEEGHAQEPEYYGNTIDISGGGIMLATELELMENDMIYLEILLGKEVIKGNGRAVRKIKKEKNKWFYGIRFEDMPEREREKIIKFIFNKQREWRKKGLL